MKDRSADEAAPVSFGERLAGSQAFATLFRDGMALVEETAAYLDGPGRQESKRLERNAALLRSSRDIVDRWIQYLRTVLTGALAYNAEGGLTDAVGRRVLDRSA